MAFLVFLGFFISVTPVHAVPITIDVQATIRDIEDHSGYLTSLIRVGDTISGSYTFDSSTPKTSTNDQFGLYNHTSSPYGIILTANDLVLEQVFLVLLRSERRRQSNLSCSTAFS